MGMKISTPAEGKRWIALSQDTLLGKMPNKLIPGITSYAQSWSFNSTSTWSSTVCGRYRSDFPR